MSGVGIREIVLEGSFGALVFWSFGLFGEGGGYTSVAAALLWFCSCCSVFPFQL
jgi:hypothetical protein